MANNFGAIGGMNLTNAREELYYPQPQKYKGKTLILKNDGSDSYPVYKKMSTKKELDKKINGLKSHYEKYLKSFAPVFINHRLKTEITSFERYQLKDLKNIDIQSYLSLKEGWTTVNIPEYGGPVGYAVSLYRTIFNIDINDDKSYFIHFQCADYIAQVFINDNFVGEHEGFFSAFEFDISAYVKNGENKLLIILKNDYSYHGEGSMENEKISLQGDKLYAATGPGFDDPVRGWHHCPAGMGLFGKIHVEERNKLFLDNTCVFPDIDSSKIEIRCDVFNTSYYPPENVKLKYSVYCDNFSTGKLVKEFSYSPVTINHVNGTDVLSEDRINSLSEKDEIIKLKFFKGENLVKVILNFPKFKLWTLNEPYLYRLNVSLSVDDIELDNQNITFGMRKFIIDTSADMKGMMYFNNEPIRLRGANTMGFEQQDVINGDFDLLLNDMLTAKACNMNFLRLTQRPVQNEIYDLCDRIGLLIQTDLPLFTNMRRYKYTEGLKQAKEMAFHTRNHPCCVVASYINEPMLNSNNFPHRHLTRDELNKFFNACDDIMSIFNPCIAIKHIDGDYDPPDTTFPDNHSYCFWYNGHGIDAGKLIRGYWLGIKKNWYCGCGEYGSEGLDSYSVMKSRYPKEYLPKSDDDPNWNPSYIKDSQTYGMHFFFYSTPNALKDWITSSHKWQTMATKYQTEAYRRNRLIVSSAIHLFIDAWPSGWMKTLIDCERNPKPAFFTYADTLSPVLCSIRPDRISFESGEYASFETYICNDTPSEYHGCKVRYELIHDEKLIKSTETAVDIPSNDVIINSRIKFKTKTNKNRDSFTLRMILLDNNMKVIHYNDQEIKVFGKQNYKEETAKVYTGKTEFINNIDKIIKDAENGSTVIVNNLEQGEYNIAGNTFKVKNCGMRSLHFVSCKSGHILTKDFEEDDFRFWFNEKSDMITPLITTTVTGDNLIPILKSGNTKTGSAWTNPMFPALCTGELKIGKGKVIINQLDLENHLCEPVARIFKNLLHTY